MRIFYGDAKYVGKFQKEIGKEEPGYLKVEGAGFGTDTNIITLITKDMEKELEIMTKAAAADEILDEIMRRMQ